MTHHRLPFLPLLASILAAGLTGCVSAPKVSYYTLDMTPSGRGPHDVNVQVRDIQAVQGLNRPQIMIQTAPTEVDYYATADWVADVGELVRRKLAADLGPPVAGRPTVVVSGTLLDFEEVDRGDATAARATLHLVVRRADAAFGPPLVDKVYEVTRTVGTRTPGAVVAVLSECVDAIAAELVADLGQVSLPASAGASTGG